MKFAFSMLRDYVATSKTAEEIGDLLTMAGFELEEIGETEGEKMLDIRVVSNRGDGLSVLGLSREVLAKDKDAKPTKLYERAANRFTLPDESQPPAPQGLTPNTQHPMVSIETADCPRYACRLFQGDFHRESPAWLQRRLKVAGMRPLGLVVDLTNYVMLEVGQPMHAFDFNKLTGHRIIVRQARAGEKLTTLNGEKHELKPHQMMICDAEKPVGVAGVMGGLESEVTDQTNCILLESASFASSSVRRTRKDLGLSTEASYRFERSVDPDGVVAALNRFAELLVVEMGDEAAMKGVIDVYRKRPERKPFAVRMDFVDRLLGVRVADGEARGYLAKLGFEIRGEGDPFEVVPPSWRPDVLEEYDAVEEIGRVHGYEKIPEAPIKGTATQGGVFEFDRFIEQVRDLMQTLGFVQNVSSSLIDYHPLDDPKGERIGPRNPISPEMALLRNSLWPNLADNARRNGGVSLRLFEIGAVFGSPEPESEVRKLGILLSGGPAVEFWQSATEVVPSFYTMKSVVEQMLSSSSLSLEWHTAEDPRLHPTRQAQLFAQSAVLFGQVHPDIAEQTGLPSVTFLAEIDLEALYEHHLGGQRFKPISRNPSVRRDIAILIDKAVPYYEIERAIADGAGDALERQWLFDVYEGKGIPEGKHSLAIALQLRKMGSNFTDEEANQVRDRAVAALGSLGATQR